MSLLIRSSQAKTVETLREESDAPPKVSEGIESELLDILNYAVFALIRVREERERRG